MEVDRKSINSDPIKSNEITTADDRADIPKSPRGEAAGRQGGRAAGRQGGRNGRMSGWPTPAPSVERPANHVPPAIRSLHFPVRNFVEGEGGSVERYLI